MDDNQNKYLDARWNKAVSHLKDGDKAGALFIFQHLAKAGELAAYREISNIYEQSTSGGVTQDFVNAKHWYSKSIEEADDVYGCIGLGRMAYYGKGCERNFSLAMEYFLMVEAKNIPTVNLMLGRMYGLGQGVEKSFEIAKGYYLKSVSEGNLIALKDLGLLEIHFKYYLKGCFHWSLAAIKIIYWTIKDKSSSKLMAQ